MGLGIFAVAKPKKVSEILYNKRDVDYDKIEDLFGNNALVLKKYSSPEYQDLCRDVEEGVYTYDPENQFSFRVGPYSWYSGFREFLSQTILKASANNVWVWPSKYQSMPFYELITFSDCEGIIGGEVSGKLYNDFVGNEKKFMAAVDADNELGFYNQGKYKETYKNWTKAFELAKNNGFVEFH
jgi:hypothetical protein